MLTSGIHSFGDTLLPRVHTASQQAYGKLRIDSVRFYAHKFLQVMSLGLRKTQKRRKLVGRTMRDVQTIIRRRSSVQDCCTSTSTSHEDLETGQQEPRACEGEKWSPPASRRSSEASRSSMERLVNFKTGSAQRERCFSWPDLEYLKFWMVKDGRKKLHTGNPSDHHRTTCHC